MIDNKWFCEPNYDREPWCFLVPRLKEQERDFFVTGWEIGYGNPKKTTRIISSSESDEREIIEELLQEIYHCKRKGITLITFRTNVLPVLRTRIVLLGFKDVSLRGVKYISIEKLLEEYFQLGELDLSNSSMLELARKMSVEIDGLSMVELLRNIFLRIGPVLPKGVIR